ncbi:MAG: preprotein translocase subunit SecY, partial [Candidatus Woesearchaeota archaeon]
LILQLTIGGLMIMFFDEVVSKWGFGSGISLFIAAGVSKTLFIRAFSWLAGSSLIVGGYTYATGAVWIIFQALAQQDSVTFALALSSILFTLIVFAASVYLMSMKVEIPLSFGMVRGQGMKWPLKFIYTSNIPVILAAALMANIQLWARLFQNWGFPLLGKFAEGTNTPISGLVKWVSIPGRTNYGLMGEIITGTLTGEHLLQAITYLLFFIIACVVFSWFWMQTSGMDSASQAKQIIASGLQIPGFRKDERIMERLLERYIPALTIMGAIAVGLLAALADLAGALANGTGILLTVMIIYQLYEEIAKQHLMDMNPMMRKFIKM